MDTLRIEYQDRRNSGNLVGPSVEYAGEIWEGKKTPVEPFCGAHAKKGCSTRTPVMPHSKSGIGHVRLKARKQGEKISII